jgi:desulfoferrodoxin (superoxide reductase-like protein)
MNLPAHDDTQAKNKNDDFIPNAKLVIKRADVTQLFFAFRYCQLHGVVIIKFV